MIRREARRIVTSPLAWFCVVIYAAVLLMGIAETLKVKEAISDHGWLDLLCVSEEYGITTLVKNLVFPFFSSKYTDATLIGNTRFFTKVVMPYSSDTHNKSNQP